MEKKQKSNWCLTCKFDAFARAYTGKKTREAAVEAMLDDCLWDKTKHDFIQSSSLCKIWNEYVEIRPFHDVDNAQTLSIVYADWDLQIDCYDTKALLRAIIKYLM